MNTENYVQTCSCGRSHRCPYTQYRGTDPAEQQNTESSPDLASHRSRQGSPSSPWLRQTCSKSLPQQPSLLDCNPIQQSESCNVIPMLIRAWPLPGVLLITVVQPLLLVNTDKTWAKKRSWLQSRGGRWRRHSVCTGGLLSCYVWQWRCWVFSSSLCHSWNVTFSSANRLPLLSKMKQSAYYAPKCCRTPTLVKLVSMIIQPLLKYTVPSLGGCKILSAELMIL